MEVKRIKCPNCGAVLDVKNSKNEALKLITCPKCKATLRVKFKQQDSQKPLEAHTYLGASPRSSKGWVNGGETQLGGSYKANGGETQLGGSYGNNGETVLSGGASPSPIGEGRGGALIVNGKRYPLSIGVNIVGRKASTSQATVQIETSDRYMSRQHARIVVTRLPGGKLKSVISNDHNKNISTIDGQDLLQGDAIVLNNGDRIVMGETTVIYKEL